MPNLKSDREQSKEIDASRQFTSVRVLLRKNTHILTYTQRVWNRQFLQGEAFREQKAQGLLLALEELTVHLFINVNEARLVFNSRKRDRDTREKMVMGVLHDFFFPCEAWQLIFSIGFLDGFSPIQRLALQKSLSDLWRYLWIYLWIQIPLLLSAFLSLLFPPLLLHWLHAKLIISPVTSCTANSGQYWIMGNANAIFSSLIASPVPSETLH